MPSATPRPDVRETPDVRRRRVLTELLGPLVAAAGFDLEELKVSVIGRRSVVRVVVDSDAGVDLDAVADISRVISTALDEESAADLIPGAYQLEVTSPGVDRALTEPRHWRRAVGRLVTVDVGGRPVTGRVVSTDPSGVVLSLDEAAGRAAARSGSARTLTVPWADLGSGRVQVEFNPPNRSTASGDQEIDDALDALDEDDEDDEDDDHARGEED